MIDEPEIFGSALIDEAIVRDMVPWPCPSDFGPNERYRLEELIGVGKQSLVYRAVDKRLSSEGFDALVAIKVAPSERLQRNEALTVRRIKHPHVVQVIDRGLCNDGTAYLVEELVTGHTLAEEPVPWPARRAAAFVAKLARGVQAIHTAGIVHCDLKPANVLIDEEGEPKIADFGMAAPDGVGASSGGNLAFMSPERFDDPVGGLAPPTDIYALGGLLYYLLVGRPPNGVTREEVERRLRERAPVPAPGVSHDLDRICERCMAADVDDRYDSAGRLADDLESWLHARPIAWTRPSRARRARLWGRRNWRASLVALVVVGALGAVIGSWTYARYRDQQLRIEAQQEAVELANERVEEIKARVRAQIEFFANNFLAVSDRDLTRQVLPNIVFLDWVTDVDVLQDMRSETVAEARIKLLRSLAEQFRMLERTDEVESLLTDYSLAYYLLVDRHPLEAFTIADRAVGTWSGRLREDDPVGMSLVAMRDLAGALIDHESGTPTDEVLARLDALEVRLARAGTCENVRDLIVHFRRLLDGTAARGEGDARS